MAVAIGQRSIRHATPNRRCRRRLGKWAQLWLFWLAPLIGGVPGGVIYRWLSDEPAGVVESRTPTRPGRQAAILWAQIPA